MYLSDIFTLPINLAGLPALAIPAHTASSLPIGFQLIGKHFDEATLFGLGHYYETMGATS
jgi:aspartyl-tRNA(Asn)/glutamyl-tRNA(Gln) amidotransferase subunit A